MGKTWKKRYVQLDFTVSLNELKRMTKEFEEAGYHPEQGILTMAFMQKCQCPQCKGAWEAFEKKQAELIGSA